MSADPFQPCHDCPAPLACTAAEECARIATPPIIRRRALEALNTGCRCGRGDVDLDPNCPMHGSAPK